MNLGSLLHAIVLEAAFARGFGSPAPEWLSPSRLTWLAGWDAHAAMAPAIYAAGYALGLDRATDRAPDPDQVTSPGWYR